MMTKVGAVQKVEVERDINAISECVRRIFTSNDKRNKS